jgi:hypothetical protein
MVDERDITFREEQQFRQPWLWGALLCTCLPALGMTLYGMYQQLISGVTWGDRPMSDTALAIVGGMSTLSILGVFYLFYKMKLITEVRSSGLVVRFFPFVKKTISYHTIRSCRAREYRPVKEYGGWGIRFSRRGRAYNVSGNQGVQLEIEGEKPLLVGSQQADRLAQAINDKING